MLKSLLQNKNCNYSPAVSTQHDSKIVTKHLSKFKKLLLLICSCIYVMYGTNVYAHHDEPDGTTISSMNNKGIILIFDNIPKIYKYKPKNYRTGLQLTSIPLNISGSAQPNLSDLEYIINNAKQLSFTNDRIFIVDLRQEPHAFLNKDAVSWYGFRNQISHNLEPELIAKLSNKKKIRVYKGIDKLINGYFIPKGYSTIAVHTVMTEKQAVTKLGVEYKRLLVNDHFAPNPNEVNAFINFVKKLPANSWVHFHCRGGKGRTTTFMVMYDIIHNAHLLSLDEILQRQHELGGSKLSIFYYHLVRKKWKEPAAKKRYEFIKNFYEYALDPNGYNTNDWSTWLETK